jgi:small-conductance mechanosensitive channel
MTPRSTRLVFLALPSLLLAQTAQTQELFSWFVQVFLSLLPWLFLYIVILMFVYAVLKAPLDVLKSKALPKFGAASLLATTVSDYFAAISSVLFSLLALIFMILLPLILILLLYKSFMALVRSK